MSRLARLAGRLRARTGRPAASHEGTGGAEQGSGQQSEQQPLAPDLTENETVLREAFGGSFDIIFRHLRPEPDGRRLLLVYLRAATDEYLLASDIIRPLWNSRFPADASPGAVVAALRDRFIGLGDVRELRSINEVLDAVLDARVVLLVDGSRVALEAHNSRWPTRGLTEPDTEIALRGPRDGFGSSVIQNVALLRKLIRNPSLRCELRSIGSKSNTRIVIAYIHGVAEQSIVKEVGRRMDAIGVEGVLESGIIAELIRDHRWSPFPLLYRTERPDRVAFSLLEGRVAILVDGTPFALVVPVVFSMFLTTADDWYEGLWAGNVLRLIRYLGFLISLLLPALYVAITSFHQEMVPTSLVLSIAEQRQGIPFPVLAEALFLQLVFELLREAGIRLPKALGPALTIVGALILGQQAVDAGLLSPFLVIIIASTGIASFVSPVYSMSLTIRLLNPLMIILSGVLGIFGVLCGVLGLLIHVTALDSFGVPYTSPFTPTSPQGLKDSLIRWPLWGAKRKPGRLPGTTLGGARDDEWGAMP